MRITCLDYQIGTLSRTTLEGITTRCIVDTMVVCAFDNFLDLSGSTEPGVSNFHRDENWERQHNARCGHGAFSVSGAMHHIEVST